MIIHNNLKSFWMGQKQWECVVWKLKFIVFFLLFHFIVTEKMIYKEKCDHLNCHFCPKLLIHTIVNFIILEWLIISKLLFYFKL